MNEQENQTPVANTSVSVRLKKRPGCIIKMDVSINQEALQATYKKALREVRKEISIPGFRRGKAPEDVIEKRFADTIDKHFKDVLIQLAFKEGLSLIKRRPFTDRSVRKVDIHFLDKNKGAEIFFEFEALPEVPDIDPQQLNLHDVPHSPPTDAESNQALFRLRLLHAEKHPAVDRELQKGDFALLTITATDKPEKPFLEKKEFYIDPEYTPEWLFHAVVGMKKNETKEATPEWKEKEAGPQSPCTILVDEIFDCVLPEENDEFAKKVRAENLEDLRAKQKARLQYETEFKAFEQIRHEVRCELIRLYAFDLPQSLIDGETEARFKPYWEIVSKQNPDASKKEELKKIFSDEVKRYFTLLFLLQPIAKKIQVQVEQPEVLEELSHQIMHAPFETRYMYAGLPEEEGHHRLLMALMTRKCEDWCIAEKLGRTPPKRGYTIT